MTTTSVAVDQRDPRLRLRALFDRGTLRLLAPEDDSGVLHARGEVDGTPAIAYANDGTGWAACWTSRAWNCTPSGRRTS